MIVVHTKGWLDNATNMYKCIDIIQSFETKYLENICTYKNKLNENINKHWLHEKLFLSLWFNGDGVGDSVMDGNECMCFLVQ